MSKHERVRFRHVNSFHRQPAPSTAFWVRWAMGVLVVAIVVGCGAVPSPSPIPPSSPAPTPAPPPSPSPSPSPSPIPLPTLSGTPWPTLPPEIYPSPLPLAPGVIVPGVQYCPNPQGLEAAHLSKAEALEVLWAFTSHDPEKVRRVTDPSHWQQIDWKRLATPARPTVPAEVRLPSERVTIPRPAAESPYGEVIRNMCGEEVLAWSWWVVVCAGPCEEALRKAPALNTHIYFIRRQGQWLIWWSSP